MGIDTFTKEDFEQSLQQSFPQYPAEDLGYIDGEYCYLIKITDRIGLYIRSSVGRDGLSASVGQDSIRVFLCEYEKVTTLTKTIYRTSYLGKSSSRWTTRISGWQRRLKEVMQDLIEYVNKSGGYCKHCDNPLHYFKVKKEGENKGRIFSTCMNKSHNKVFIWIT